MVGRERSQSGQFVPPQWTLRDSQINGTAKREGPAEKRGEHDGA